MPPPEPHKTWQEALIAECQRQRIPAPVYNTVSDRRGGRTRWSSTVTLRGQTLQARYWYDDESSNNAKEDAAEVGMTHLRPNVPVGPPLKSEPRDPSLPYQDYTQLKWV